MRWLTQRLEDFRPAREFDYLHNISPDNLAREDVRLVVFDLDHTLTGLGSKNIPVENLCLLAKLKLSGINYRVTTGHPYRPYLFDIEEQIGQPVIRTCNIFSLCASLIRKVWREVNCLPHQTVVVNDSRILLAPAKRMGCLTYRVMPIYHEEKGFASSSLRLLRWFDDKILLPYLIKSDTF